MRSPRPSATTIIKRLLDSEAGRSQPCAVVLRFAWWQLWRRALRKPMRFRTATGTRLALIPGASDSLSGVWYLGLPDFEELAFVLHLLRPGDLFVDVGANQGAWTLLAAGRGARVFAFEPIPLTHQRLCANIAANPRAIADLVRVFACGLGDEVGTASFTTHLDVGNHRLRGPGDADGDVLTLKLDRADNLLRGEQPTVVKIDVEGEELGVLQGATEVLAGTSLQAVIMETFRPQRFGDPALIEAEAILRRHGFLPHAYEPRTRKLTALLSPSEGTQNTLYVRAADEVQARVRGAPPLAAFGQRI